jgi:hypothetical protein
MGWWMLLGFLTLGIVLEAMHGFKIRWYLDMANSTRRMMWTLAHAHGVLLALVNIAFSVTVAALDGWNGRARRIASPCLLGAGIALPGGFFLGGLVIHAGDPGVGICLVPLGAAMLFVAVALTAWGTGHDNLESKEKGQASDAAGDDR